MTKKLTTAKTIYLILSILMVLAVIAVSGLTVILLDRQPKPKPSPCPELIEKHQLTGVPAHIKIKCREFLWSQK